MKIWSHWTIDKIKSYVAKKQKRVYFDSFYLIHNCPLFLLCYAVDEKMKKPVNTTVHKITYEGGEIKEYQIRNHYGVTSSTVARYLILITFTFIVLLFEFILKKGEG